MAGARNVRGLLLAGGSATRFGSAKLLHPYQGSTLGATSARNLIDGVGEVLAIVREGDAELANSLREAGCEVLATPRSRDGIGASIAAGIEATKDAQGWVLALADMPRVSADISRAVAEKIASGARVCAPMLPTGERGHPVGFSSSLKDELLALTGDHGARSVLERYRGHTTTVATANRGILFDIDRPADLVEVVLREAKPAEAEPLSALAVRAKAHWGYAPEVLAGWQGELNVTAAELAKPKAWVAEHDGKLAGFYVLRGEGQAIELDHLWVDPPFLRRGIGRTLVDHALSTARSLGARSVEVDADPHAEAFYAACGAHRMDAVAAPIPGEPDRVRPRMRFVL